MKPRVQTRRIATIAVFAAIYAILDLIPVSRLIGANSTLTMAEVFSPLAGMILGPFAGGASVVLGTFVAAPGHPLVFDGLDFIPALMAAVTAGLAIKRRTAWAIVLSLALLVIYSLDPYSMPFIGVGTVSVPYYWLQIVGLIAFAVVWYSDRRGLRFATRDMLIVATVLLSTMNAEVGGGIMYENVFVLTGVESARAMISSWPLFFYVYPIERIFYTAVGSILAIPVLRVIPRQTLEMLRGSEARVRAARRSPSPSPWSQPFPPGHGLRWFLPLSPSSWRRRSPSRRSSAPGSRASTPQRGWLRPG